MLYRQNSRKKGGSSNGIPVVGGIDCSNHIGNLCASCDPGYFQSGNDCLLKQCTCLNGMPVADGMDCPNHGQDVCQSCNAGYHEVNGHCLIKKCSCLNGIAVADGTDCPTQRSQMGQKSESF